MRGTARPIMKVGSNPPNPEQERKELRRLSPELGTRTKLEIMDSVVILEHLKVEEPNLESVGLMFIPEPEKETSRNQFGKVDASTYKKDDSPEKGNEFQGKPKLKGVNWRVAESRY